ncbi:MAG: hypothetical protein UY23_C0001G0389 [Candidatus Jorgensenbacteria bacterium GW2011_GWA1_48_11]|uniref:DUF1573 domain-containing protein n=1 Tax=Candidatus Jorgensenbacteria bacterium GW2011_GWA1_48_11 TaxID=1618660 RepID=A0A0G1WN56_9BACT|nr:MAG: hypothetical protein UY23_C0001G0389 [Candidatus Jorgensenbacteria bacterium GW2011_GWA1_48_11]KKW12274.1 MAG: hypothetical protein UY51_C0005G0516 [Candidatus Jorgensenbacteria bacterium GW2011_GWB1_49_9]
MIRPFLSEVILTTLPRNEFFVRRTLIWERAFLFVEKIKNMKKNKDIVIGILASLAIVAGLIAWSQSAETGETAALKNLGPSQLVANESSFDFGTISMARGKVSRVFKFRNDGSGPAVLSRVYTSCMCTEASLISAAGRLGPFGMLGMGFNPPIRETIPPGGEGEVEVVFDPAAHGPAGVGRINRVVSLEQASAAPLEFSFTANVIP